MFDCLLPIRERTTSKSRNAGFTLLEVLIALAVFALLSSAIAGQTSSSIRTQSTLETKRVASQLLHNTLEQYQLMTNLARAGRNSKTVEFADRYWRVEVLIENTRRADMRSITAAVYESDSGSRRFASEKSRQAVAQLTAYMGTN